MGSELVSQHAWAVSIAAIDLLQPEPLAVQWTVGRIKALVCVYKHTHLYLAGHGHLRAEDKRPVT